MMSFRKSLCGSFRVVLFLACFSANLLLAFSVGPKSSFGADTAQAGPKPPGGETETETKKTEAKKADAKKDEKADALAIVGGDIVTVTREVIRGGTVLIEDGKITALGNAVVIPEGTRQIDATGKIVTPGFVAMSVSRVGLSPSGDRGASYVDELDPFDRNISLSLGVGITTACIEIRTSGGRGSRRAPQDSFPFTERFLGLDPDIDQLSEAEEQTTRDYGEFISTCPCCGLPILPTEPLTPTQPTPITPQKNAVIKMSYGKLDGMFVKENAVLDVTPGSLAGASNQRTWREQLEKARTYLEEQAAHERATAAGKKEKPPRKPVSDEILALVKGEIALRISVNSVSDIRSMVQLSEELDYKLVIVGGGESWVISDELAAADVSVVLTPRNRRSATFGQEDRSGTWIETPRVLEETGVPFAIEALSSSISLGGLAGRDLTSLPLEAAFAVRGGASERKALAALTIEPAKMLGLDDRIGSLEVGKDADLLVLNGPPLDYRTYVETAVVNGNIVYERAKAKVLPVYDR